MARIKRLLVANRGEIARRIFRTCRLMGVETAAVYAGPDERLPFVREADIAVALQGRTAAETYLDVEKVLAAAAATGADAIHPGYGFLSENAGFARAVTAAGLTWVGPHADAIAAMGDKLSAKRLLAAAGVPMLPGIEVQGEPGQELLGQAREIGYPVLVKASGGGGGRGMRIVADPSRLAAAVASARREAKSAFANDTVFLERYLQHSRHIEVQVFGDTHGSVVHLFERECSIQRRHQKVVEEAPSPAVAPLLRARLGEAAVAAAKAIGYDNAGTVEFLLDESGEFFFLEMNTRLQVEHPVTEEITGLDLVREQLRVAEGHPLSFAQEDVRIRGHAVEVRLYAEDPARDFLPSPGPVLLFEPPVEVPHRMESAVQTGTEVSVFFDPMIAKVICHAPTRDEAALRLAQVLRRLRIHGLTTNRDFLVNVLEHEAYLAGDTTTDFIERVAPARTAARGPGLVEACAAVLFDVVGRHATEARLPGIPPGWRNNPSGGTAVDLEYAGADGVATRSLRYSARDQSSFHFEAVGVEAGLDVTVLELHEDGVTLRAEQPGAAATAARYDVFRYEDRAWVQRRGGDEFTFRELPRFPRPKSQAQAGGYAAPMPGKVVAVHVRPGDQVREGQLLLVLEAMKMEHHITAAAAGRVAAVNVEPGQQVEGGMNLVQLEAEEG